MKGILLKFDHNCVAEIGDSNLELAKTMACHPFNLEILVDYDPTKILIEEKTKELEKLKVADLKELGAELGDLVLTDENGKDLKKADMISNIIKQLL